MNEQNKPYEENNDIHLSFNGDKKESAEQPLYTGEIKETHQNDEFEENYDEKPRQNFVTGNPNDDDDTPASKGKKIPVAMILASVALIGLALIIAVFFIWRGRTPETASVKDNTLKLGVNSNVNTSGAPNFQTDYQNRYGANTTDANLMAANNNPSGVPNPPYGTVGNITAPPNANGSIFQPTPMPNAQPSPQNNQNNSGNGFSGGGNRNETTRVKPNRNTEIVELPNNQNQDVSYRNTSGGRNDQVSLYFYDRNNSNGSGNLSRIELENSAPVKPSFGTVLPIRILGKLHTLGTNGFARMELTRTVQGSWGTIPRGTMFVGRVAGGEGNRLFVSLIGYIDSRSGGLVTLGGDLQGIDGALGMQGDVKRLGSRWNKVFGELLSTAKQVGSAYLLGRSGGSGTVINNGSLESIPNALENKQATKYVVVPAGANGYIVLNELPPAIESDERLGSTKKLSDEEILKMIQTDSDGDLQNLMPQLSSDGRLIAQRALENK